MNPEQSIQERSGSRCELCGATEGLHIYAVPSSPEQGVASSLHTCRVCTEQIEDLGKRDPKHWRCLNDSMWSEVPAVQVVAWRMLHGFQGESWARALLDMLYLEDQVLSWAQAGAEPEAQEEQVVHVDSNGVSLQAGDNVVLIKDLPVKGGGFTAKRGTAVRGINLVHDNPEHIEGRVQGQKIVILTKFVKRS